MKMESKHVLAALGLLAAIIAAIVGIWILLLGWPLLVAVVIFVVFAVIVLVILFGVLVAIAAVPVYFLKRRGPEEGTYRIEDLKSIKEDERK
jgi:fatty acid desaturase